MGWPNGWKFDVSIKSQRQSFLQFMDFVRRTLGVGGVLMQDARRLSPQVDHPRYQDLELSAHRRTIVLRLRTDNLYVVGFRNEAGGWFRFRGVGDIPGIESEELPITDRYGSRNDRNDNSLGSLTGLRLSSGALEAAVTSLASYAGGRNELLGIWLTTLIVSFIEASRLTAVAATVATAMGSTEQVLSSRLIDQIHNWGGLSTVVLLGTNTRYTDPPRNLFTQFNEDWDIRDVVTAAAALGLVLLERRRGAGPSRRLLAYAAPSTAESDDGAYGITVLEVLSVMIVNIDGENPGDLYGTVRVHDSFGVVDLFNRERSC